MKRIGIVSLACAAAFTVACAGEPGDDVATRDSGSVFDDNTSAIGTSGEAQRSTIAGSSAQEFVSEMMAGGAAEVELGKIAAQRATNPDVKAFAQRMVKDHSRASEQLKAVASKHNLQTTATTAKHRDEIDRLSALKGAEFDREYMDAMVEKHEDTIDKLESRADNVDRNTSNVAPRAPGADASPEGRTAAGSRPGEPVGTAGAGQGLDAAANQWAAQVLPTVRTHLEQAKSIQERLDERQ